MSISIVVVMLGLSLGWKLYGGQAPEPAAPDVLEEALPVVWRALRDRLYVDEFYDATVIRFYHWFAQVADWLDRKVWGGAVTAVAASFGIWARLNRLLDARVVDGCFDKGCEELAVSGGLLSLMQTGRVQSYLRILALAVVVLIAILIWSSKA
jgi:NADH-quinone oxidoreductase subunit L